jgi:hypothetical protein
VIEAVREKIGFSGRREGDQEQQRKTHI